MLFKVHDKDEIATVPADVLTMRSICVDSLRRIQRCREFVLDTCDNRPFLSASSDEDRLKFAASLMRTAMRVSHRSIMPSPSAGAFLTSLRDDGHENGLVARFASRIFGTAKPDPRQAAKRELEKFLGLYPEFNVLAFRHGEKQSSEFMAEFEIDFPVFREAVFESRKPFTHLLLSEGEFHQLVKIHDEFTHEVLGRYSVSELEEFIEAGFPAEAPFIEDNIEPV